MELRDFAERILFARTLEEKLWCPDTISDEHPGKPTAAPPAPGRPPNLQFKAQASAHRDFPGLHRLEEEPERGRLLHFFANHELLATELMALVLLKFPNAPAAFRRGVVQTMKDEQLHTRLYLREMERYGINFGAMPVSGYFWRCISGMEHPIDYVAGLSLTFEQANLDYCRQFAGVFDKVGDEQTARLLDRIYRDEIGHVACGLKWFRRWKNPQESDWEAFCHQLKFPLSPQRAKGPVLNVEGRREAGIDMEFIAELNVYSKSKGRTPGVFVFNPFAEGRIAQGRAFTPGKYQSALALDLANLPQFLCRQDDIVLVPRRPSMRFLSGIKDAGFPLPEFVQVPAVGRIPLDSELLRRKLGELRPWAWGPDSVDLLAPLMAHSSQPARGAGDHFNPRISALYSKAWSAEFLGSVLSRYSKESWLCTESDVGIPVNSMAAALEAVVGIRKRGRQRIVVKQALGLAGHNSIRLWEPQISNTQQRWMERALQNGQTLVVEPWQEREMDFSVQLEMRSDGLKLMGYTGLLNDLKGQFQANWAAPNCFRKPPPELGKYSCSIPDFMGRVIRLYAHIFALLQKELRQAGYIGPLGIDAFVYHTAAGDYGLKPIVEINPRYTMGRLMLELMKRAAPGTYGMFRILSRSTLRAKGFASPADYAEERGRTAPVSLAGEPVPRIIRGELCLNDPTVAEACLATFSVAKSFSDLVES
jgi:uncharacterized ferritin-like protein (DUF455 family)